VVRANVGVNTVELQQVVGHAGAPAAFFATGATPR
jgi:hypothetical protein